MIKKLYIYILTIVVLITIALQSCKKSQSISEADENEWFSGGQQTVFSSGSGAYSQMFSALNEEKEQLHETGDMMFEAVFNSDPQQLHYGLGPIYNNVSCASCHIGDGRGKAPDTGESLSSLLLRLSIPGSNLHGGPNPIIGFGGQLQQRALLNVQKEADVQVSYTETNYQFSDGETYSLRKPIYTLTNSYTALPANYMVSARMATPVFGLGLLEAIAESDITTNADENDANADGISGKANYVWNVLDERKSLGRFGWKAGQPTVLQQSAGAFNQDMGITSFVFPEESSFGQPQNAFANNKKEITDSLMFAVAFYVKTLAVPGRRNVDDAAVQKGKQLFIQVGCANCHKPRFKTETNMAAPELSNQLIFPYTDLLLHDMGQELADFRSEFDANGYEWRTAPLWGIGLTQLVNGHNNFLHDGRARNLIEAVMWHGGESFTSKNKFANLSKAERDALLKFLNSL